VLRGCDKGGYTQQDEINRAAEPEYLHGPGVSNQDSGNAESSKSGV
jgi:hypothetical protein